ncbi:putative cysteine synthase A CysK2 [Streptomyces violaceusniger]|uniref:Putative cysteine synthase A CysK2 n=1 Tax=Streptomyces violaceusniger TaxID=68280 RepID=A0A4D4LD81_STRVO|nr:putative cysteine synthase A CysK2 [Streptomyces violaceusniger]
MSEPLVPAGRGFWAKLEGFDPGGIKDRPGLHMVQRARARGDLRPGGRIIEPTSGTLGLGLALAGMVYHHPVTLVTDPGLELSMTRLLTAFGAQVNVVSEPHPTGGWQQARRDRVQRLLDQHQGSWCPDQYNNPDNVAAYTPLALELAAISTCWCAASAPVDTLPGSPGSCDSSTAELTVVGVDTVGSTIFGQPARPRLMRGLGSSIYPRNVAYDQFSEVHWVAPAEAVWTCRQLAASHYATGGWSVGAVALVAGRLVRTMPAKARIVTIFPDGPQRYLGTVYDDDYCAAHGLLGSPPAPEPDLIGRLDEKVVHRWTRCTTVADPLTLQDATEVPLEEATASYRSERCRPGGAKTPRTLRAQGARACCRSGERWWPTGPSCSSRSP